MPAGPRGDVAAFGLPGELAQGVDGDQVLGGLGAHRGLHRGVGRVLAEPFGFLAGPVGEVAEQVGFGPPVAGHHRGVELGLRDAQDVLAAWRQAERGVVAPADHDAPGQQPVDAAR